jgi:hypothetical protein
MEDRSPSPAAESLRGYAIGYGRPPISSRWEKGQSGNPAGKKPRDRSFGKLFSKVANDRVTIKVAGMPRRVTRIDALVISIMNQAAKGKSTAAKLALKLISRHGLPGYIEKLPKPNTIYLDCLGRPQLDNAFYWSPELNAKFEKLPKSLSDVAGSASS